MFKSWVKPSSDYLSIEELVAQDIFVVGHDTIVEGVPSMWLSDGINV